MPPSRRRNGTFASSLPWLILGLGLVGATLAYLFYGRGGPLDLDVVRVVSRLESWKLDQAAALLAEMKEKGETREVERLSRELQARRKAWREAERIYAPIWARRRTLPEGKMIEALRAAIGRAEEEGKRLTAQALELKLSNLSEALLASLGDPSSRRAARFLAGEKARIRTAEVVDQVDRLVAENRYGAALQLLDQARAEARSPETAEDYASKKRAVLNRLKKQAWAALSRAYDLANAGLPGEAVALLRKVQASFPSDPSLTHLRWKLKGAEYEIRPLVGSLGPGKGKARLPDKGGVEKVPDWGEVTGSGKGRGKKPPLRESPGAQPGKGAGGKSGRGAAREKPGLDGAALFAQAQAALRQWKFSQAARLFEKAAPAVAGAAEKARLARARAAYLDALAEGIRKNPASFKGVRIEDGGKADFLGADREGVDALLDGDRERLGWPLVGLEALVRLGARVDLSPLARLGRALLARQGGMEKVFALSLEKAVSADPSLEPEVQKILARATGKAGPFAWFEGRWIPSAEKKALLETRAAEKEALRALGAGDFRARAAALEKLAEKGGIQRDTVIRILRKRIEEDAERLSKNPFFSRLQKIAALRQELDKRRKRALDLIFDKDKYFYPFKPPACPPEKAKKYWPVQQEVDKRVAAVREIWNRKVSLRIPRDVMKYAGEALWALKELEVLGSPDLDSAEALEFVRRLPLKEGVVTVRNFAWTYRERRMLDLNRRILRYDAVADVDATKAEMDEMNITNEYRLMMGRRALAVNEKLLKAARAHSKEMADLGYFSHFSPTKELRTPFMRMAREGYTRGVSENIARVPGAEGAHMAWLHSSGHHRNILNPAHTEFATGNWGIYWTQNFGQGRDYLADPLFEKE